jgi:IS5 family transposase
VLAALGEHVREDVELPDHTVEAQPQHVEATLSLGGRRPRSAPLGSTRAEAWQAVHERVVRKAIELGVESGKKVRTDCMVIESNIHHPNDSSLLGNCVRVFTRLMAKRRRSSVWRLAAIVCARSGA